MAFDASECRCPLQHSFIQYAPLLQAAADSNLLKYLLGMVVGIGSEAPQARQALSSMQYSADMEQRCAVVGTEWELRDCAQERIDRAAQPSSRDCSRQWSR